MLKTGAILNFLVAAGHLACLPWLYPVLSIYRIDGIMETLALRYGAAIPYLLTVAIAFIFAVFGLYGLSGAGLRDILAGRYDTPAAAAHRNPQPQVAEGIWLGARPEIHAMMDLSDGLASDIRHIMERSGVGAAIDIGRIPLAQGADVETAACGGEDYKLLLTADTAAADRLAADFRARFGTPLHPVGHITDSDKLEWLENGRPRALDWHGFTHY